MMIIISLGGHLLKLLFGCCEELLFIKWLRGYELKVVINNLKFSACTSRGDKGTPVHKTYNAQLGRWQSRVNQVIYDIQKPQVMEPWQLVTAIRWQRMMDQNMFPQNMSIMSDKY